MEKFEQEAKDLLNAIGGTNNIKSVTHCVTRMRFILVDSTIANIEAIETIPCVKGTFIQSGQFQVIIGQEVPLFYQTFLNVSGFQEGKQEIQEVTSQTPLQKMMGILGEIFAPLIPAIICGGLILGLENILRELNVFLYGQVLLELISQAIFLMLPIGIVWSITKKMNGSQILGIVLGSVIVLPRLMGIGTGHGQVIEAMVAGFIFVYLERFLNKRIPQILQIVIVPFVTLILSSCLTLLVVAPFSSIIEQGIANILYGLFTSPWRILLGAIIGATYMFLVMTGLHHISNVIDLILMSAFNGTFIWPTLALVNIAQGASTLAMAAYSRKKEMLTASMSCFCGVTEPALFGVNRKYRFPFYCGLIGSMLAGGLSMYFNIQAYSIGVGGILGIISIPIQQWAYFLLAMLIAIMVPFSLTYIKAKKVESRSNSDFISPMQGHLIPLSKVEDQVFSQGLMGDGFAIELEKADVVAPFSGEVIMTFPTKHTYGLRKEDGLEVLIHIGMDTVQLEGKGFESFVSQGDVVKQGQVLAKVDLDYVVKQNKKLVSPVVFTSGQHIEVKEQDVELYQENIFKWKEEQKNETI